LCGRATQACSTGNCIVDACVPVAGTSLETVMPSSCRLNDSGVIAEIAPYTGVLDPTTSQVAVNIGGNAISGSATGTVGFSSGVIGSGTFALTSLQAQVLGPIQFFGRRIDSFQVTLRRPLIAAEQPDEAGKHFALIVNPEDLAAQVVVGGVAQFLSLDAIGSLSGTFNSDGTIFTLAGAQTQPTGDNISVNLTALTINSPPQPTITVTPGAVLECTGNRAASATFSASTVDPDPGASIKRIQWVVGNSGQIDSQLTALGAGSIVTASLSLGEHPVTAVAYDQHEAAGRATVDVQVRDTVAPIVSAPPDQTFYAGVGGTSVEVNLGAANIQETCDSSPKVTVVTSLDPDSPLRGVPIPNPGDVVLPVGQIPIVWTATDSSGNIGSAVQTVRVLAESAPAGTPDPPPITIPAPACSGGAMPVSPPGSLSVSVDVRVCVVGRINAGVREGAAPWEDSTDAASEDSKIRDLLAPANMDYLGFVSFNYIGVQRIRDPYPPQPDGTEPNDPCSNRTNVVYHYGDACLMANSQNDVGLEGNAMRADYYAAWGYPDLANDACQRSIILILVRGVDFLSQEPGICGAGTPAIPLNPVISAQSCQDPQLVANNTSGAYAIASTETLATSGTNDCVSEGPFEIAHELGHALGLGHGDGLDDNCSGAWDSFCDTFETESGPQTLMFPISPSTGFLTPLQLDRARIYATKSLPMAASSTSVCPTVSPPEAPGDLPAPPPGCGCSVAGAEGSVWLVALIGFVILSRRRTRARR
jgi:MYXO-CTERM domain-containing protein